MIGRGFDILDGVAETTRLALSSCARKRFVPGAALLHAGEQVNIVHRIASGAAKVSRNLSSGEPVTLCHLGRHDVPGLPGCMQRTAVHNNVTALSDVEADAWPSTLLRRLFVADAVFARNGMMVLSGYIRILSRNFEQHVGPVDGRIARSLLGLAAETGRWAPADRAELHVSRQEIAEMTGSTLSTVSRTLSAWQRAGLVESARERVTIVDLSAFSRLADSPGR